MSDTESRVKHSKRIHSRNTVIAKQVKIAKAHGLSTREPHKFAKNHAMDCGNPDCHMCGNPRKLHKDKLTIQEKRFYQEEEVHGYHGIDEEDPAMLDT